MNESLFFCFNDKYFVKSCIVGFYKVRSFPLRIEWHRKMKPYWNLVYRHYVVMELDNGRREYQRVYDEFTGGYGASTNQDRVLSNYLYKFNNPN
jgi:hypothetical protein